MGARLSWPLFDWGRRADQSRAQADYAQATHLHRAASLKAKASRETAAHRVQSCRRRYRIVSQAFESARRAMNQATTRYDEGTLPLMDYSQAIQNWVTMKLNLIQNRLEVVDAGAEYDFQRGGA